MKKSVLSLLVVGILLTFSFATAYSQDFSIWKGKWFKVTYKVSGYYTDASGKILSGQGNVTNYLQVSDVQENEKVLIVDWYDNAGNYYGQINFYVLGENSLDFLCGFAVSATDGSSFFMGLTARIQGKMKNSDLSSGSFKTVGGFSWGVVETQAGYTEYSAVNLTWTGTLIPESKVPF
jgi:hypothetical protein